MMIKVRNDGLHEVDQPPDSDVDYGVDWRDDLKSGEIITISTWSSSVGNIFFKEQNINGITSTFVRLAKNLDGRKLIVKNSIVTNQGFRTSRILLINCKPL